MFNMKMRYVNHLGDVFEFGEEAGAYLSDFDELLSWEWGYTSTGNTISGLSRKSKSANIIVLFDGTVPESRGRFFQIVEADALYAKEGELWFGDYYVKGIFTKATNTPHYGAGELTKEMVFIVSNPVWTRSITKLFKKEQTKALLINEGFFSAPVTIEAFGDADGVSVSIGDNNYVVNQSIPKDCRLVINGLTKTIELVKEDGSVENAISKRDGRQVKGSGYYVFENIPSGVSELTWRHSSMIRVTVHEMVSELRWT